MNDKDNQELARLLKGSSSNTNQGTAGRMDGSGGRAPERGNRHMEPSYLTSPITASRDVRKSPGSRPSSRPTSRATSPTASDTSDDLPNNVSEFEQLALLPPECLSGDEARPLLHIDEAGDEFHYALKPMFYSVIYILMIELLERFAFYGINYTQTSYLTGAYDEEWNAGMEAVSASTYVSVSVAVAYTTPFVGAVLADSWLGDYWTILVGSIVFYVPGLLLIAFTTIPGLLGEDFNRTALAVGLLFMWPVGTGIVKSVVNVFGAKQHHPLLQSSLIESYYVKFYMCINIGALVGGILVPIMAQHTVTVAYFLPVVMVTVGSSLFVLGTPRYVCPRPKEDELDKSKTFSPPTESIDLSVILRISLLIIPFCIAYSQMATTFIVQGTVMEKALGWIDAACMNNADAMAVLLFGSLIGDHFYPFLAERNIKISTTYKFAIGSALGAAAIAWAVMVEYMIHAEFARSGQKISIMWQAGAYVLIGAGEIFAVSAAYEAAFTASPPEKKVLASAVNLFCIGGLPNVICIFLYHACERWFQNSHGNRKITHLEDYTTAHVGYYFMLLLAIALTGVFINVLPLVREWVDSIEEKAVDLIKTPKTPIRPPRQERAASEAGHSEEEALLRAKRHQAYLKYGSGPVLFKHGSMRAGASRRSLNIKGPKPLQSRIVKRLYRSEKFGQIPGSRPGGKDGRLMQVSNLIPPQRASADDGPVIVRSNSG